ncbi:MAG: helix-turn-helix domain-containing protein [Bacteroidales bacterium]
MIERIQKIMQEKNLSASQFAEALGIQRSGLSHILSGRNQPSLEFVKKLIQRFPDVDLYWLLTGEKAKQEKKTEIKREPDLFSQIEEETVKVSPITSSEARQKAEPSVSDLTLGGNEKAPVTESRATTKVKVQKVLLLFEDGTYQIMTPGD